MRSDQDKLKVMIAGIGGASLGTEILKSLLLAKNYEIYGCDISPVAYGLYDNNFTQTFLIKRHNYILEVMNLCQRLGIDCLIPGGEEPNVLLVKAQNDFLAKGVHFIANTEEIIEICSNKAKTFEILARQGIETPRTAAVDQFEDLEKIGLPCIIKPATGSGGSVSVFFASTKDEAWLYADFIKKSGSTPVAQEYIDLSVGEFTVGVLSLPTGKIVGSVALRRAFDSKLSWMYKGRNAVISSGYSQGYIDFFPDICTQAEKIAATLGSRGPLNIQGRVRDGLFLPFEINPRFSASTYLRAKAGFNELDLFLQYVIKGVLPKGPVINVGWYMRSLTEQFVPAKDIKNEH